jgi:hypothetical protein
MILNSFQTNNVFIADERVFSQKKRVAKGSGNVCDTTLYRLGWTQHAHHAIKTPAQSTILFVRTLELQRPACAILLFL